MNDYAAIVNQWFYLCLTLCGVILAMLAMFFGYNLKLDGRTAKLEKKNGAEQHQIDELKTKLQSLENLLKQVNLAKSPAPSISPCPPNPNFTPSPNANDFVTELKDKLKTGKIKPSEFK